MLPYNNVTIKLEPGVITCIARHIFHMSNTELRINSFITCYGLVAKFTFLL